MVHWGPSHPVGASGHSQCQWQCSGPVGQWPQCLSATMIRGLGPGGAGRASGGPGGRRPPSAAVRRAPWLAALLAAVLAESPSQRRVAVPRRAQPHCSGLKPRADEWSFIQEAENRNRDEAAICRCQPVKIINLSMKIAVFFNGTSASHCARHASAAGPKVEPSSPCGPELVGAPHAPASPPHSTLPSAKGSYGGHGHHGALAQGA